MPTITPSFVDSKTTAETVRVMFPFSDLVDSIDLVVSVTVSVVIGTDATPDAIKNGVATISGTLVTQHIQGGVDGVTYLINCIIAKGIERYAVACYLPVADYK